MTDPEPSEVDVWSTRRRLGDAFSRAAGARAARREVHRAPRHRVPLESPRKSPKAAPRRSPLAIWRWLAIWRDGHRDRGAASVMILAIGLLLVGAGVAGAAVGAARIGRHQAQAAADLGALAGAARAIEGPEAACAEAARYVAANAARMSACAVDGLEIVVHVELALEIRPGPVRYARAAARAGPIYVVA